MIPAAHFCHVFFISLNFIFAVEQKNCVITIYIASFTSFHFLCFPLFGLRLLTVAFLWMICYSSDSLKIDWNGKQHLKGFIDGDGVWVWGGGNGMFLFFFKPLVTQRTVHTFVFLCWHMKHFHSTFIYCIVLESNALGTTMNYHLKINFVLCRKRTLQQQSAL